MGRSVAVLDWADIQMLVKICSHSVPPDDERFQELDPLRHSLVESFLIYFREWQPGHEIDDEVRKPLIEALETLSEAVAPAKSTFWRRKGSFEEIQTECLRIAKRLRSALTPDDRDGEGGDGSAPLLPGSLAALLVYIGGWLAQSFAALRVARTSSSDLLFE